MGKTDYTATRDITVRITCLYFPLNQKSFGFKGSRPKGHTVVSDYNQAAEETETGNKPGLTQRTNLFPPSTPGTTLISSTVGAIVFRLGPVYLEELLPFILYLLTN